MRRLFIFALMMVGAPASAEVLRSSANGFEIRHVAEVRSAPAEVLRRFEQVGSWWNPEHSYSGAAKNLSLSLKPGGCFCETLPNGGGVEHMRVTYVDPGKRAILTGALGPLLFEATTGVMDVRVEPTATGSRLTFSYKAAGFATGGADKIAPIVDQVLGDQVQRLKKASETL